jgi:TolC family type I secretion outer membrane protein
MMIKRTIAAACAAGALFAGSAIEAPSRAETLVDALVLAYQNNPALLAERARLRATDETVPQALSGWRPTVSIDGDIGWRYRNRTLTGGDKTSDTTVPRRGSLTIDQNLYSGGRTVAATRRAENLVRSDRARLLRTEQAVLLSAVTAYVDVVRDQAVVELNINNERVLRRQLEATRDRFEVGEVTRTDVAQAESRLSRATADRIRSEGDLVNSRAAYRNIMGDAPGKLAPAKSPKNLPANEDETVTMARERNYAVIEADFVERAARDRVDEVTGELLPELNLSGDMSRDYEGITQDSETDIVSITATLSVPLYQSGSVSSRIREAKQVVAQRRNERNRSVRDATEEATRSWESLQTALAQIRSFTDEVRATGIALEGVQQEALVGSRTVLDVLDAEQELLDARVSLVRAEREEVVAAFQLRSAIGQMTAESLKLPVKLYDFTDNYRRVRNKWFGLGVEKE